MKKQTPAEIEAEMKRIREQNQRFKEEMAKRAEEARKKKLEEKAKEKERKKEETKLVKELMNEWKKPRDDLLCEDLKELPKPKPVHCKIPNQLFGDFLTLMEFIHNFSDLLETTDSFPQGVTFEILEQALTDDETIGGALHDVLSFLLGALFDLQDEEDEEVKVDKLTANADALDKNILGKDVDIANQIKSATSMAQWPMRTQGGQKLRDLHMDQWSITEILRLHLEAAGAFRSEKLIMWLYQQRGGYRLSDDPGLSFRMEEPQIHEALNTKTVYELDVTSKIKILNCLMYQILSFATVRDEIDEKYNDVTEAKAELRNHQIAENKRKRAIEEAEKEKRKEERMQIAENKKTQEKKDGDSKEGGEENSEDKEAAKKESNKKQPPAPLPVEAHLTERQRLAIQSQKEKEERDRQREEDAKKEKAAIIGEQLLTRLSELQTKAGMSLLGRDRAYRRFWVVDALPGLFVEHDDDFVGPCLDSPTPMDANAGPMDEDAAVKKVRQMMDSKSPEEKSSSDKENDQEDGSNTNKISDVSKTYSKKQPAILKQKILSTKNGGLESQQQQTMELEPTTAGGSSTTPTVNGSSSPVEDAKDAFNNKSAVVKTEAPELPWGACLADNEACSVHSTIMPKTYWAYYSSASELDSLIDSLNDRGIREHDLKEKLLGERDRITKNLKNFDSFEPKLQSQENTKPEEDTKGVAEPDEEGSISSIVDLTIRDQILELEEKIFYGTLGTLHIKDRAAWQSAIQAGGYDKQCDSLTWGGKTASEIESRIQSAAESRDGSPDRENGTNGGNKRDSTGSNAARRLNKKVQGLSSAILQVAQMLETKYFKPPLGEDEKQKKKRAAEEEKKKKVRMKA